MAVTPQVGRLEEMSRALPGAARMMEATSRTMLWMSENGLRVGGRMVTIGVEGAAGRLEDTLGFWSKLVSCRSPSEALEAQLAYATALMERFQADARRVLEAETEELEKVAASVPPVEPARRDRAREAA